GHGQPAIVREEAAAAALKLGPPEPADLTGRLERQQFPGERAGIEIAGRFAARHEDSGTNGPCQEAGRLNRVGLTGALMVNVATLRSRPDSPRTRTVVLNATFTPSTAR